MASIEMKNIVKKYGDGFPAVNDVSIDVADGEFMILVGPSGCGKSTLLRMIVGLEDITSGDMMIGEKKVNDLAPRDRNLAMVFQNYALYPHLTVYENIAFPLRLQKRSQKEIDEKVREAIKTLDLDEHPHGARADVVLRGTRPVQPAVRPARHGLRDRHDPGDRHRPVVPAQNRGPPGVPRRGGGLQMRPARFRNT